jgi:raffinose synthase
VEHTAARECRRNMRDKPSGLTRFRSGDWHAAVHACARAVSGGPVYVSDRPGTMGATVLAKVAVRNGRVPQCLGVGLPTTGCLFSNPLTVYQG